MFGAQDCAEGRYFRDLSRHVPGELLGQSIPHCVISVFRVDIKWFENEMQMQWMSTSLERVDCSPYFTFQQGMHVSALAHQADVGRPQQQEI